jgi:bifunctional UDP-N-acetylglucosamine pyrophosphorylase/glucosamine-1-phosphate N-acetyltransferase
MTLTSIILAAGQGTRMKSNRPKVLHPLLGQPFLDYAIRAAQTVTEHPPVVVIGHGADAVRAAFGDRALYAMQAEQLGTGHAVRQAEPMAREQGELVLVTYGDMPLIRAETLQALVARQRTHTGPLTLLTVQTPNLRDFGRIVRDEAGHLRAIVEAAHATPAEFALTEVNPGCYCFNADWLWANLPRLPLSPKGEYYLTDLVGIAVGDGLAVASVTITDTDEVIGINTRVQLAQAEAALRRRLNEQWMLAGVTLSDPATTYIGPDVQIGRDTCLLPNTHLEGRTTIGARCVLGPNTIVRDSVLGDECAVECSVVEGATLAEHVAVGPFAHLRSGARLERGAHMGNFGEVKNATLGPGVKMGHFSYIGDAVIGAETNIGAGTITCNYDGKQKNKTVIGEQVFIGSDTMLVAPITLGDGARTGAGSVVTKNVPDHALAVGVPARVIRREVAR